MIKRTTRRTVEVSRGCLTGSGSTKADAKQDLEGQIDKALDGYYSPSVLTHGGMTAIVYRTPHGWEYTTATTEQLQVSGRVSTCEHTGFPDRRKAEQSAWYHVLQTTLDVQATRTDRDVPPWLTDEEKRRELLAWCRWQRAAAFVKAGGETDHDAVHRWACDHYREAQFT